MKVVAGMDPRMPLAQVPRHARRVEALGYDVLHVPETVHDSLAVALLALEHTDRIVVRTSVTLAFPRSPMVVAYAAWDLAQHSGGRFHLGLGTQVRQNIEGRFSVEWSDPVGRMGDYVDSLVAIFRSFQTGEPLRHEGPHYRFDRLQPYFTPARVEGVVAPPIWLGGVNGAMCRLAGEKAAGLVTHPTGSDPTHLRSVCLPSVEAGLEAAGRDRSGFELVVGPPWITARGPEGLAGAEAHQRRMLAFLFSTPAYARNLDRQGFTGLGERLRATIREGRWDDLERDLPVEVLDALVPRATWDELAEVVRERYGGLVDGVVVPPPADPGHDAEFAAALEAVRSVAPAARPGPPGGPAS